MTLTTDDKKYLDESFTEQDKKTENSIVDAINEIIIPAMNNLTEDIKHNLGIKIDSLDRKFDAQQERLDRHSDRIEKLEKLLSS